MAACVHARRVGSEANFDKSREQAFRPLDGGELSERHDKCDDKRQNKLRDIGGCCRRTYPKLLWQLDAVLRP